MDFKEEGREEGVKEEVAREEEVVHSALSEEETEEDSKETDLSETEAEDPKGVAKNKESEERIQRVHVRSLVNQVENLLIRKNKKRDLMLS